MARSVEVARKITRSGAPVVHLVTEDGKAYSLHFTPEQAQIGGLGWDIGSIDRQGRKPLTRRKSQSARTLGFSHTVGRLIRGDMDGGATTTAAVASLMALADSGRKVRIINATSGIETRGWWWPSLQVTVSERDVKQQIKTAELAWSLTEAIEDRPKIARAPVPPPPRKPPSKAGQPDYIVRRGDSLWKIAAAKLGAGTRWREIYNLNQKRLHLTAPVIYRGLLTVWIYPGQVLKIPPR